MKINFKAFMDLLGKKLKIYLPEILTGVGVGAMGGAVVTAIVVTPKAHEKIQEHKEKIEQLRDAAETNPNVENDIRKEKVKMVADVAKSYWLTALLLTGGAAAVISADGIHCKREATLAGQLGTAIAGLKTISDRLEEKYGKDEADKIIYGTKEIEDKETKTNKRTGKTTELTKIREVIDPKTAEKAFWFCIDDTNPIWPEQKTFTQEEASAQSGMVWRNLVEIEFAFNQRLQREGNVLMNPVLKELRLPQIYGKTISYDWLGWFYNTSDCNPKYHNHISFGLDDPINDRFRSGLERCVWIKLTPDGSIFQELKNANLITALFERSE